MEVFFMKHNYELRSEINRMPIIFETLEECSAMVQYLQFKNTDVVFTDLTDKNDICEFDFDLYVGACVMEEVGQRGATTATGLVKPDLGVVLGCKKAKTLDEKDQSVGELGKGLLVSFYDKGMMPNRGLLDALVQICKEEDIAYQHYYSMDLNEGAWVHKLFAGCPTLNVSIAIQNAYSAIESMDLNDYDCAKKALTVFVEHLNEEKIQEFKESNR